MDLSWKTLEHLVSRLGFYSRGRFTFRFVCYLEITKMNHFDNYTVFSHFSVMCYFVEIDEI